MNQTSRFPAVLFSALLLIPSTGLSQTSAEPASEPAAAGAGKLDQVMAERIGGDRDAKASQERIDQLDDETQKLLTDYRRALADKESYETYAVQLEGQLESQQEEMSTIQQQLDEVETTSRSVAPLVQKMLDTLERFVALDLPFLPEERTNRITTLKDMLTRADVTVSEKYRRILEAYQVEMDYGRTIEAYEGKLGRETNARTVQFLRVGRVALLYQTLDGEETGYWNATTKNWDVDNHYRHAFKQGIAVAKKTSAPEMLLIPVAAPRGAAS